MYMLLLYYDTNAYFSGLKPGGQYEVQVLGATQNGLPNIDFTWYFIELPPINPVLPIPVLSYSFVQSLIKVCILICVIKTFCSLAHVYD